MLHIQVNHGYPISTYYFLCMLDTRSIDWMARNESFTVVTFCLLVWDYLPSPKKSSFFAGFLADWPCTPHRIGGNSFAEAPRFEGKKRPGFRCVDENPRKPIH